MEIEQNGNKEMVNSEVINATFLTSELFGSMRAHTLHDYY